MKVRRTTMYTSMVVLMDSQCRCWYWCRIPPSSNSPNLQVGWNEHGFKSLRRFFLCFVADDRLDGLCGARLWKWTLCHSFNSFSSLCKELVQSWCRPLLCVPQTQSHLGVLQNLASGLEMPLIYFCKDNNSRKIVDKTFGITFFIAKFNNRLKIAIFIETSENCQKKKNSYAIWTLSLCETFKNTLPKHKV